MAGTVDDAGDEDTVFFRAVEDQVVADRKGAETGEKMIDRMPKCGCPTGWAMTALKRSMR